jgi:hypothetical protein
MKVRGVRVVSVAGWGAAQAVRVKKVMRKKWKKLGLFMDWVDFLGRF